MPAMKIRKERPWGAAKADGPPGYFPAQPHLLQSDLCGSTGMEQTTAEGVQTSRRNPETHALAEDGDSFWSFLWGTRRHTIQEMEAEWVQHGAREHQGVHRR